MFKEPEVKLPSDGKAGEKGGWSKFKTIPYYTGRNDFALSLLALSEISPTHRNCIYTKAEYGYSDGFGISVGKTQTIVKTQSKKEKAVVADEVIEAVENDLYDINNEGDSLLDIGIKARVNLETSGNAFIELVRGDINGKRFFSVYVHDFHKCLFADVNTPDATPTHVYVAQDWADISTVEKEPVKLPLYPEWEVINGSERTVIHVKSYSIGRDFYGLPLFIAAKIPAQLEYESDRHNIERFFSDFMPKFFAAFFAPDGMTDTEKEKFYDDFFDTYTKKKRDGNRSAMVQIFESEAMKPFFHEFGNQDNEGNFIDLKENSGQSIYTAHRWHPVLAGVPISGGLNDAKQIQNLFSIYNKLTIKPNQTFDLKKFINPIFYMMAEWLNAPYKGHELTLSTSSPISFFNDLDLNSILTVDEARTNLGQDKIGDERGKKLITEVKAKTESKIVQEQ